MFDQAPEALRKIDEAAWDTPQALVDMERSICGLSHSDLGALACEHWHLPENIAYVVGQHHQRFGPNPKLKREKLAVLVQVADLAMFPSAVPGTASLSDADQQTLEDGIYRRLPDFLRPFASELRALIRTSTDETEALCRTLGVA
jgi:HD-like signal output (HDOD) protein